jgi:hypothetical protein
LAAGQAEVGFSFNYGRRSGPQRGVDPIADPEDENTQSRVYAFDLGLGIWKGLSARLMFPMVDVSFSEGDVSGSEFGIGDLSFWLRYGVALGGVRKPLKIGAAVGVFLPTGGTVQSDIPSNPNFVSGTVDPLISADVNYDLDFGLGFYARIFARLVAYESSDYYQAGHTVVYMGVVHYRLFGSLMPSLGLTALNRSSEEFFGVTQPNSGGDWIYLTPNVSYVFTSGPLSGLSLFITAQIPLYQFLHGTQLAEEFNFTVGAAYGFQVFGE